MKQESKARWREVMRHLKVLIFGALALFFLAGCQMKTEEVVEQTFEAIEKSRESEVKERNITLKELSFYLPEQMKVAEEIDDYNILLTQGKQQFLLFVNPNETPKSSMAFENSLVIASDKVIHEIEQTEDTFYFSLIDPVDEYNSELIIGRGGTKLTTVAKNKELEQFAQTMEEIVRSVKKNSKLKEESKNN